MAREVLRGRKAAVAVAPAVADELIDSGSFVAAADGAAAGIRNAAAPVANDLAA